MVWLGVIGLHITNFYLFSTHQHVNHPHLTSLFYPLPLLHAPLLYLYTKHQTSTKPLTRWDLLHLAPLIIFLVLFAEFYSMTGDQKIQVYNESGSRFQLQLNIHILLIHLSGIIYIPLSFWQLTRYHKNLVNQFSNTEKINFNWLLYLIIWMGLIWVVIIFVKQDRFIFAAAALFMLWLGYFGIKQVQVFSQQTKDIEPGEGYSKYDVAVQDGKHEDTAKESPPVNKYLKSTLSENDQEQIYNSLQRLFETTKPHLNPELTLSDLARALHTHPNYLSQVINTREQKNFYDLINQKRIEEFLKISADPNSQQFTMLANAFACGFNSKASFNRNFKKYTGRTPSEYLKQPL